jgi:site-specific recombinase XerD
MTPNALNCDNTQLVTEYLRHRRFDWPRPETRRVRAYQVGRLSEEVPNLIAASEEDLLRWRDSLRGAPETVAQYVSVACGFYYWLAAVRKLRPDNPAQVLSRPKIPIRPPRPMVDRHYDFALACALTAGNPEMYLWLGLMGCSGFRCCEVAWARTNDIEEFPDGRGIGQITGKGGKVRPIPIGKMIMTTLRPFLLGGGHIFTRPNGEPWTPKRVSETTNDFLRSIGVHETAHTIRHRFGTDYHKIDPDLFRQAKIMGHSNVTTTQLYTEVDPVEAAKYIEVLTRRRMHRPAA